MEHIFLRALSEPTVSRAPSFASTHAQSAQEISGGGRLSDVTDLRDALCQAASAYCGAHDELVLIDPTIGDPDLTAIDVDPHADVLYIAPDDAASDFEDLLAGYDDVRAIHVLAPSPKGLGRRFLLADGAGSCREPDLVCARIVAAAQRRLMAHGHVLIERRRIDCGGDAAADAAGAWLAAPIDDA